MKKKVFRGAGVAIITPFTETGVNYPELGRIIEDQIAGGTDAIIITGTTGESATMTDAEHREAIRFAVEQVGGRIPVVAGTGSNETAYAVELSQYAEQVGADALLLVTPYYNKCTQNGLVAHYTEIADSVSIPAILYNVPSRTGVNIKTETYVQLAKHPRIVAVKEASGDLSAILRLRAAVGDELAVYSGNDDQIVPILSLGGLGVISVLSNVAPRATHDICQHYFDGNTAEAARLQIAYSDLIDALFCEVNPIPVKTAMRRLGYDAGPLRMPLSEMEPANAAKLDAALRAHGLIK
ncbi:4-hydroxy-tetrahydrodipicolinate synthase [Selenomonas sp. oral taxon 126]|uniref:4-hydroxy-tetrahydrodipicolinate synthase n=1 Tax=Selenomonas sp. oral taxon 126 TaxID=712528 RepID=UPI0008078B6A|nr:4-hydroxy-tetrahydrodipicolinate synthase [Selenomonas sp. oral taxon 126]ANR69555.1 4-hydroxy-tetrahydrodipicolinate synthase [Selenomonas sp. oral taxon 126]